MGNLYSNAAATAGSSSSRDSQATVDREPPSDDDSTEPVRCGGFVHNDLEHPARSLSVMNEMRDNDELCDVCLRVGNGVIRAHRLVLASSSPYFHAMFNDDMAEKRRPEVELRELEPDAVRSLVEFAYTGRVWITEENVRKLFFTSSFLQIDSVQNACYTFLANNLRPTNCLDTWRFADTHSCDRLIAASRDYALRHFEVAAKSDEFLRLSYTEIESFVSDDGLCVTAENAVFSAVMRWIKNDVGARSQYVASLMGHVRLARISKQFLFDVVCAEPLVCDELGCNRLLLDAIKYQQFPEMSTGLSSKQMERRTGGRFPYVFAIGGRNETTVFNSGFRYDPRNDRWLSIAPMSQCRADAGVVSLDNWIYAVGGYNGSAYISVGLLNYYLSSAERYDPVDNKWSAIASMGTCRTGLGLGAIHGQLYACGGYNGSTALNTVERYDPTTGVWSSCPSMTTCRRGVGVSVVDNCLYALGGFVGDFRYLYTTERYDPRMSKWMAAPYMTVPRASFAVARLDDVLYCVGGLYNVCNTCLSSAERLNVRRNAWEPVADMVCRRRNHGMVAVEGGLLVLGGFIDDFNSPLNSTERYDPLKDQWTMATPITMRSGQLGATLLYTDTELTTATVNTS